MSTVALAPASRRSVGRPARWWWDRAILVGGLLVATLLAWRELMHMQAHAHAGASFPLLLLLWAVMMVAMMLPAASPMIVTYSTVSGRHGGPVIWHTALFVTAYLGVWSIVSAGAALAQAGLFTVTAHADHGRIASPLFFALALLGAGAWQLTPLKHACLRRCRTPLGFLITEWRPGGRGALAMGARHGTECVVCCWALMAVMLGLGTMNLAAMAMLTVLMVAEKVAPGGHRIGRAAAFPLIVWGGWQLMTLA